MEYRPFYLSREWARAGHSVTIVAAAFSHLRRKKPEVAGSTAQETIEGVTYLWLKSRPYSENGIGRVGNIFEFLFRLLWQSARLLRCRPDLVIASSTYPLDIFPAWLIARLSGARLVHDLWPLSSIELGGMSRLHPFIVLLQFAEDFACRFSDRVVSLLPAAGPHLESREMKRGKFVYQPNVVCISEWTTEQSGASMRVAREIEEAKKNGEFVLGYAGGHGISNVLEPLIRAAVRLRNEPITVLMVGDGPSRKSLEKNGNRSWGIQTAIHGIHSEVRDSSKTSAF